MQLVKLQDTVSSVHFLQTFNVRANRFATVKQFFPHDLWYKTSMHFSPWQISNIVIFDSTHKEKWFVLAGFKKILDIK